MKSLAAVAHDLRSPFVIEEIELPELEDSDVLVRIVGVGICHTDLASRDGQLPSRFPAVFGHEGAGVVERVGGRVRKVRPGDHVVLAPDSDGTCESCVSGEPTYCDRFVELNFQVGSKGRTAKVAGGGSAFIKYFGQSSFASYALAGERNVVKVRRELPLKRLGPLGCSVQTGAGTVINGLRPPAGASIVVLGTGPVGMAAILGAVVCGCATIIAVDRIASRLELALQLGATHAIDTTRSADVGAAIRAIVARGAQFMVDAAGAAPLIATAIAGLSRRGSVGLIAAPPSPDKVLDLPWSSLLLQGQSVRGFIEGNSIPDIFIPRLCELHAQGRLPFERLVRFYPFREINRAVDEQRAGIAIKPILVVEGA